MFYDIMEIKFNTNNPEFSDPSDPISITVQFLNSKCVFHVEDHSEKNSSIGFCMTLDKMKELKAVIELAEFQLKKQIKTITCQKDL